MTLQKEQMDALLELEAVSGFSIAGLDDYGDGETSIKELFENHMRFMNSLIADCNQIKFPE